MPTHPCTKNKGVKITFGPENKHYTITADMNSNGLTDTIQTTTELTRSAAVLRLQPYGKPVSNNPFFNPASPNSPINDIYAYGIRNSFGLDFDPISGFLWDSENGPTEFDELNLIRPGFNSGWQDIMGPTSRTGQSTAGLTSLGAAANYVDPRFSWVNPVAPTDVHFLRNSHLGLDYKSDMFVGTARTGAILHYDLSFSRKSLALTGGLADTVADNTGSARLAEQDSIVFGIGFGTITDIITGPGGMYVLSLEGNLYRISQDPSSGMMFAQLAELDAPIAVPEPIAAPALLACGAAWSLKRPRRRAGANPPRAA
jgi:glucose/arabinose dehydrogenase